MENFELINALVLISNFVLIPALSYGSQLALATLSLTIIYGVLRFSNFAQADWMSFGTMTTILFTWSPIVMDEIFDRIIQIKETGVAVVIVEQNAKQALKIADFGHVLVNGENRFYGKGNELLTDPEVRKSFLGG